MIPLCIQQVRVREWWSSIYLSSVILLLELHDHSLSLSTLKMALQVRLNMMVFSIKHTCSYLITVSPGDYGGVIGQIIQFNTGDTNQTHTIIIRQDDICEDDPNEFFFSNIQLDSGLPIINVIRPQATVIIDDSGEIECGKYYSCIIL